MAVQSEGKETCALEEIDGQCRAIVSVSFDRPSDLLSWEADKAWCIRLMKVCSEGVRQRYLSAWFSTLGGAHSALGDSVADHAKKAGLISKQQLALAELMGDPLGEESRKLPKSSVENSNKNVVVLVATLDSGPPAADNRMTSAQDRVKTLEQYWFATQESPVQDKKLIDMCLAGWARAQELKPSIPTLTDSANYIFPSCGVQFQHQSIS